MATMNISLPEQMREFVEEQISAGGYGTASEYFRSLVREDQRRKAEEQLEALLLDGIAGKSAKLGKKDWDYIRGEVKRRAGKRRGSAS